jgi:hypothetical protein
MAQSPLEPDGSDVATSVQCPRSLSGPVKHDLREDGGLPADRYKRFNQKLVDRPKEFNSKAALVAPSLALLLVTLAGCASNSSLNPPKSLSDLYGTYEQTLIQQLNSKISPAGEITVTTGADRNQIMNELLLLIDNHYYSIEKQLYGHNAWANFAGSVVSTGLGTAGAIAGGGTAQIMSALVAAVQSTNTAFNKDILQGQTITAIIAKMRAARATKLVYIRKSMQNPSLADYPLSQGLIDLLEYYNDGTFVGALQSITEQAAADTQKAQTALNQGVKGLPSIDQLIKK